MTDRIKKLEKKIKKLAFPKKKRDYGSGIAFVCSECGEQVESWRYAPFCRKHWKNHRYD